MLEVRHVPTEIGAKTMSVVLAYHGWWPVDLNDHRQAAGLASEQIALTTTEQIANGFEESSGRHLLNQLRQPIRNVEWREIWDQK